MERVVIDTNVYIDWLNEGQHEAVLFQRDVVKYLSAVVLMELSAGAFSVRDRWLVQEVISAFAKVDRILVPTVTIYEDAGDVLTIKPDGTETIDYNGMKPIEGNGETHLWRGIVEAYFTTSNGTATVTKAGKTDLTVKETYRDGRTTEKNTKALGLAALGNYPTDRSYACDGTTLKFKSPLHTATFKREKK